MKIDSVPAIVQIEPEILKSLVTEVKETLALGIQLPATKNRLFTAADMWSIRRNAKTAVARLRK